MIEESTTLKNWDEKVSLCQQWQTSGLSIRKFCEEKNLAVSTFNGWCTRLWSSKRKSKLCEVQITNPKRATTMPSESTPIVIEIALGNSVTARVEAIGNQVGFLLQELVHATTTLR